MSDFHDPIGRCYFCADQDQLRNSINDLNDGGTTETVDWDSPPELCPFLDDDEFRRLNGETA